MKDHLKDSWEKEYAHPTFISLGSEPMQDVKNFVRWLRKDQKIDVDSLTILDVGCGVGKNSLFLAENGCTVHGFDISETAISIASDRARHLEAVPGSGIACYQVADIRKPLPYKDKIFDVVFDVMTSHLLNLKERDEYLKEVHRVLKPNGYYMLRTFAKEGDKNALRLIKDSQLDEKDTYIEPVLRNSERVSSEVDLVTMSALGLDVVHKARIEHYMTIRGVKYKRHYWIAYCKGQ